MNFFDTANVYQQGLSEEILGKCLASRRSNIVLASKASRCNGRSAPLSRVIPKAIRTAIEETLKRLQTDHLDIYYLHQPDYDTPVEETLEAMHEIYKEGKIRYLGSSNYAAWQICDMFNVCRQQIPCRAVDFPAHVQRRSTRGIEQEYVSFARRFEISCICYNPLAGGMLTGKQDWGRGPLPGTRFDGNENYQRRYWHPEYFEAVQALQKRGRAERPKPRRACALVDHESALGECGHPGSIEPRAVATESCRRAKPAAGTRGFGGMR